MKKNDPNVDYGFHAVTPRLVRTGYKEVKPLQKWLYVCLKDLCGEAGTCYRTIETLAEETGISTGFLSESIPILHDAGLIHAEKKRRTTGGKKVWHITIVDIWQLNATAHPTKRSQREQNANIHDVNIHTVNDNPSEYSPREQKRSHCEPEYSQCETEEESTEAVSESSIIFEAGEGIDANASPPSEVPVSYSDGYRQEGEKEYGATTRPHDAGRPQGNGNGLSRSALVGASPLRQEEGLAPSQQTTSLLPLPDGAALAAHSPPADAAQQASSGPRRSGGKRGKQARDETSLLCDPAKVRAALLAFRGYALEGVGAIINENKVINAWCQRHTEEELSLVIEALKQDRYWGKQENREHFFISNFETETPKMLARLKRAGAPRVLDDGATSEWNFANYLGNGPEAIAALLARGKEYEAQGLLDF